MPVDTEGLVPNSNKYKQQQKDKPELTKAVTGKITTRKKTFGRRFADLFFVENTESLKEFVIFDVLVPAVKDTIVDVINKATDMLFYGRIRGGKSSATYTSYSSYSKKEPVQAPKRQRYSADDIVFESRAEAEHIKEMLAELIDVYGQATLADLYDLVGITSEYTDNNVGWKDIGGSYISSVREGYLLVLPRLKQLD